MLAPVWLDILLLLGDCIAWFLCDFCTKMLLFRSFPTPCHATPSSYVTVEALSRVARIFFLLDPFALQAPRRSPGGQKRRFPAQNQQKITETWRHKQNTSNEHIS